MKLIFFFVTIQWVWSCQSVHKSSEVKETGESVRIYDGWIDDVSLKVDRGENTVDLLEINLANTAGAIQSLGPRSPDLHTWKDFWTTEKKKSGAQLIKEAQSLAANLESLAVEIRRTGRQKESSGEGASRDIPEQVFQKDIVTPATKLEADARDFREQAPEVVANLEKVQGDTSVLRSKSYLIYRKILVTLRTDLAVLANNVERLRGYRTIRGPVTDTGGRPLGPLAWGNYHSATEKDTCGHAFISKQDRLTADLYRIIVKRTSEHRCRADSVIMRCRLSTGKCQGFGMNSGAEAPFAVTMELDRQKGFVIQEPKSVAVRYSLDRTEADWFSNHDKSITINPFIEFAGEGNYLGEDLLSLENGNYVLTDGTGADVSCDRAQVSVGRSTLDSWEILVKRPKRSSCTADRIFWSGCKEGDKECGGGALRNEGSSSLASKEVRIRFINSHTFNLSYRTSSGKTNSVTYMRP